MTGPGCLSGAPALRLTRAALVLCAAALFIVFPALSFDYGQTPDEELAHYYGERVYNYYASGFKNQDAKTFSNMYFYGGLFEAASVVAQKSVAALGLNRYFEDVYEVRHLLGSLSGALAVVVAGFMGRRLFGLWGGVLASALLLASPRFVAHAMNNPKDVPFAALFALALYLMLGMRTRWPYIGRGRLAALVVVAALATAIRIGGLLLVCYAGLFVGVSWLVEKNRPDLRRTLASAGVFLGAFAAMLCIQALFSPWQLENPLIRPFQSLREMSNLTGYWDQVLFDGVVRSYKETPWNYALRWFWLATPPVVFLGLGLATLLPLRRYARPQVLLLWFSVVFPLAYAVLRGVWLYHDMRHFFFVYPGMVVLAAGGFVWGCRRLCAAWDSGAWRVACRIGVLALLTLLLYDPVRFSIANHPNQAVYFNPLAGGIRQAFYTDELDYWINSNKAAKAWIKKAAEMSGRQPSDYEIITMNLSIHDRIKALSNPRNAHAITVDGVPLVLIRLKEQAPDKAQEGAGNG
ncbi:MAG: glycosyltransferase family 39 protein [Acidobacteriota bacterium]